MAAWRSTGPPDGQVVLEELHVTRGVRVAIFRRAIELDNGVRESCAGHLTRLTGVAKHTVLKDGVVQG
eukprot:11157651-Lingulodinium_polyedra.AAC.1